MAMLFNIQHQNMSALKGNKRKNEKKIMTNDVKKYNVISQPLNIFTFTFDLACAKGVERIVHS